MNYDDLRDFAVKKMVEGFYLLLEANDLLPAKELVGIEEFVIRHFETYDEAKEVLGETERKLELLVKSFDFGTKITPRET